MNNKLNNSKKTLALAIMAVMFVFLGNGISDQAKIAFAGQTENGTPSENQQSGSVPTDKENDNQTESIGSKCLTEMRPFILAESLKYQKDINDNFNNKSSTSSLFNLGYERYAKLSATLNKKVRSYLPLENSQIIIESNILMECQSEVNDALIIAQNQLNYKAEQTSIVKQSTALNDKYKIINDKLAALNTKLMDMKGYLETMAAKVPCYIDKRCNTGS